MHAFSITQRDGLKCRWCGAAWRACLPEGTVYYSLWTSHSPCLMLIRLNYNDCSSFHVVKWDLMRFQWTNIHITSFHLIPFDYIKSDFNGLHNSIEPCSSIPKCKHIFFFNISSPLVFYIILMTTETLQNKCLWKRKYSPRLIKSGLRSWARRSTHSWWWSRQPMKYSER